MKPIRLLASAAGLLCLAGAALPASAETLGRLFFTPERRAALERQRLLNIQVTQQAIEGETLAVSGIVKRSSGRNTAWVNGAPQYDANASAGVRVEIDRSNPGTATVTAGEETPASLKVGEAINRATRKTNSGIGEGRIVVKGGGAK